ncbi:hypothetical protein BP6252_06539 [Coleophoma cylindrospora]|uniref:Uncharacterized protein n=1 Tax=Coleophoma cylindrospora TaxID=1849047 RepID=A0A3D8RMV6_9HELO|nr:hypothetical protein BP6252_06539 [Coleophoma cylindrospora]
MCYPTGQNHALAFSSQKNLDQHAQQIHTSQGLRGSSRTHFGNSTNSVLSTNTAADKVDESQLDSQLSTKRRQGDDGLERNGHASQGIQDIKRARTNKFDKQNSRFYSQNSLYNSSSKSLSVEGTINVDETFVNNVSFEEFVLLAQNLPLTDAISYDSSRNSIKIQCERSSIRLHEIFLHQNLRAIRSSGKPIMSEDSSSNKLDIHSSSTATSKSHKEPPAKVFAIRQLEDSPLIDFWVRSLLPALFEILDQYIAGDEYSMSLVREGATEGSAKAVVRIESPRVPDEPAKKLIRDSIDTKCDVSSLGIRLRFVCAQFLFIVGKEPYPDDQERRELPYNTRYWKRPGMGASIGLSISQKDFATLCCHVQMNNTRYILTVDHFIDESIKNRNVEAGESLNLTSPALSKVESTKLELQVLLDDILREICLEKEWLKREASRRSVKGDDFKLLKELVWKEQEIKRWLTELQQESDEFQIGTLTHRCEKNGTIRLSTDHSNVPFIQEERFRCHRADWALFQTHKSRLGANRLRYKLPDRLGNVEYELEDEENGDGDTVYNTAIVEPNEEVYICGQTSGVIYGQVNAAMKGFSSCDGLRTTEHHILVSADLQGCKHNYGGDSGSPVLRKSDNKIIGILFGESRDDLFFTPIGTVFEDIKRQCDVIEVSLPQEPEKPSPCAPLTLLPPSGRLISGNEDDEPPPRRPYKHSDIRIPARSKIDEATEHKLQVFLRGLNDSSPNSQTRNSDDQNHEPSLLVPRCSATRSSISSRSTSPVPSLSSSRSPTPNQKVEPPTTLSSSKNLLIVKDSMDQCVRIADGDNYPTESGEARVGHGTCPYNFHAVEKLLESSLNKFSIDYITNRTSKSAEWSGSVPNIPEYIMTRRLRTW